MTSAARRALVLLFAVAACKRAVVTAEPDAEPPRDAATAADATAHVDAGISTTPTALVEGSAEQTITLPGGRIVTVRPVSPALIEVTVDKPGRKVEVEREAAGVHQRDVLDRIGKDPIRSLHAAKPGVTYTYRARAGGAWSKEVTVRTADSAGPPPSPTTFRAQATTPFAVKLTWEVDARAAAGFEIEIGDEDSWKRVAIVDPTERAFVHHHRLPGRAYAYRVRAFSARGASAPSPDAKVTTPEQGEPSKAPPPPCLPNANPPAAHEDGVGRMVVSDDPDHTLYNDPGKNRMYRRLVGRYEGCFRELGTFDQQDPAFSEVTGFADEGFPLLRAVEGAGMYAGATVGTLRFSRGRYTVVDEAFFCGEPPGDPDPTDPKVGTGVDGELTQLAPPFPGCQHVE